VVINFEGIIVKTLFIVYAWLTGFELFLWQRWFFHGWIPLWN